MVKKYQETEDNIVCKICHETFKYLGSHIAHKHKIKTKQYKSLYGLDYNLPLMNAETYKKKQDAFEARREHYLKNLTRDFSFVKGNRNRNYFSRSNIKKVTKQIEQVNNKRKKENCPVCNMRFVHLDSHLANMHGLKRIGGK